MKQVVLFFSILSLAFLGMSQTKDSTVLDQKATQELMKSIKSQMKNPIGQFATHACDCIDSISLVNKKQSVIATEVSDCIDKQVMMYQLMSETMSITLDTANNHTIVLADDKNSAAYKKYYYELERFLMDSCQAIQIAVNANNLHNENSVSNNPLALDRYKQGEEEMAKGNYRAALNHFENAVTIDPKFAFCWDNMGICHRKLGNYEEAIAAYKQSLLYDPTGMTPMRNIAVVYEYQKKFDLAASAYRNIVKQYPDDPEGYFGLGRILFIQDEMEDGLDNMCKAYNLYTKMKSPFRTDAEKMIGGMYEQMKEKGKEKLFQKVLKKNNISTK